MLELASTSLPSGYQIHLKEGFRPASLQRTGFEHVLGRIAKKYQHLSEADCRRIASEYVAPPEVAGHPTGGAVDVTLLYDGSELNLGTEFNAEPDETEQRTYTGSHGLTEEERANRNILINAMTSVGFINYPTEWWHWSFGDKYWSWISRKKVRYEPIETLE